MKKIECKECGFKTEYDTRSEQFTSYKCPKCGNKCLSVHIDLGSDPIDFNLHETVKGKMKKKGVKKPLKEIINGEELNISENKWVQKTRIIDRENDTYYEEVSDQGEIIHHCKEKLSEHRGHGSAKNK